MNKQLTIKCPDYGFIVGAYSIKDGIIPYYINIRELTDCCGIHILHNLELVSKDMLQLMLETVLPKVRLLIATHNDTETGTQVVKWLKDFGFVEVTTVPSNHPEHGNIHLLIKHGTLAPPSIEVEDEEMIEEMWQTR